MTLTPEQLAERRTMITATDTVTLAGEGYRDRSAIDIYMEKIGEAPDSFVGNTAMRIGSHLEPLALILLAEERGLTITPGVTERHGELTFLGATADGNVMVEDKRVAVAEAKVVGLWNAKRWTTSPPDRVVIQVMKQMIVTKVRLAHVVALVGTEPRYYFVDYDDTLASALVDLDTNFWKNHVLARIPPAPEATEGAARALRQLYPRVKGDVFRASPAVEEIAREYFAARTELEAAIERTLGAENALKAVIAEHKGVDGDGWQATWQDRKGAVSWKNIAEKLLPLDPSLKPDDYRNAGSRTFICKATTGSKED